MGYKEIRDAIQSQISENLTDVEGTSSTVHERIPENILDAYGYSIIVQPPNSAFSIRSTSQIPDVQTWTIDVYSPGAGTSYRSEHEDRLLEYAERIVTIFTNIRSFDLAGVMGVKLGTLRFNDGDFPIASNSVKYHFALTLIIEYSRAR